ncbi:S1 RNA-binding domain-containing protein [Allorhodopirellula heiligendammensis]|nr:S1 RNA-binding domain-containing protein [Allorhodopirellula heiligendammensis]
MSVTENPDSNPPSASPDPSANAAEAPAETSPPNTAPPSEGAENSAQPAESSAAPTESPAQPTPNPVAAKKSKAPLPRIGSGPLAARGLGVAKPQSPAAVSTEDLEKAKPKSGGKSGGGQKKQAPRPRLAGETDEDVTSTRKVEAPKPGKVSVPNIRHGLSDDLQAELDASLADSDLDSFYGGTAGLPDRRGSLEEGARVQATVLKIKEDTVFVSLGGPDEGTVPFEQFTEAEPAPGSVVEVLVRGFSREDGLYSCTLPGSAIEVSDWDDIDEGSVVEALVTGHNTGGLECQVGSIKAFMPISQVTEYRVEDLSEFVDQKMVCLVNEANARRGNLVISRRAILERERESKRQEQLEKIEAGDILEGIVRSVRDFGAFVDLGGLDGLIHVSKLSWDRVKHPSDVIKEGQKVKVKVDKIDKQTGKIGLSYRDLLENPWDTAESEFAVGSLHSGTVTKTADFGCFVRLAAGVEGLVHISELANHRVSKVSSVVNAGDTVEVKILSFDRDAQKIGLSIKAALAANEPVATKAEEEVDEPPRDVAIQPQHSGPLKGGNNRDTGGERFGLRW